MTVHILYKCWTQSPKFLKEIMYNVLYLAVAELKRPKECEHLMRNPS